MTSDVDRHEPEGEVDDGLEVVDGRPLEDADDGGADQDPDEDLAGHRRQVEPLRERTEPDSGDEDDGEGQEGIRVEDHVRMPEGSTKEEDHSGRPGPQERAVARSDAHRGVACEARRLQSPLMARLQDRLDAIRKGFEKEAPPEALEVMHRATRDLAAQIAQQPGLGVGDSAPPFRLPDQDGNVVDSAELLARGPLVLTLFRGHW